MRRKAHLACKGAATAKLNRLNRTTRGALYIGIFLDLLGFGMIIPDIQFRAERLGASGVVIGALLASTFVVQFFVSPLWGGTGDRVGQKPVLLICQILSALGMLVYGLATAIPILFLSRVISGAGGANVAVAQAIIGKSVSDAERITVMGRLSAAVSSGLVFGPALGGYLAGVHHQNVGLVAACCSAVGIGILAIAVPSVHARTGQDSKKALMLNFSLLRDLPAVRDLAIIAVVAWFSLATLEGTFGRLIERTLGFGQAEFGAIFAYESAIMLTVQSFALEWLTREKHEGKLLRNSYLLQGVGLALPPFVYLLPNFGGKIGYMGVLLACSTLYAFGAAVANPTINSLCSRLTPEFRQGELFGLLQGTRSVGFVVGPIIGGFLFGRWFAAPYVLAGMVCVAAALLVSVNAKLLSRSSDS